ncbi:GNAT family N-acetyltransferase [Nocardioides dilutus]
MRIRRAEPRDHAAIGEVTVAAYADLDEAAEAGYIEKLRDAAARDREAELWVATTSDTDDTVLGTVTVCHDGSPWREIGRGEEGEFRMLAVAPWAQGQGVGSALVELCINRFREVGAPRVVLSTLPSMHAAHRLYERHGFNRAPDRDWSPVAGVDLVAYLLDLAP